MKIKQNYKHAVMCNLYFQDRTFIQDAVKELMRNPNRRVMIKGDIQTNLFKGSAGDDDTFLFLEANDEKTDLIIDQERESLTLQIKREDIPTFCDYILKNTQGVQNSVGIPLIIHHNKKYRCFVVSYFGGRHIERENVFDMNKIKQEISRILSEIPKELNA